MAKASRDVIVEDIVRFIKWAEQFENGEYLFRGVPSACYSIEASSYRRLSKNKKTPEALLEINQDLIAEARHQGHDLKDGQKLRGLELLAELQHFGAATGLIDFSYNALVALWFACWKSPSEENKNGKVVVLRTDGLEPLTKVDYNLSQKDIEFFFRPDEAGRYTLYQWQPKGQNYRIVAQQSVFVFGGAPIEIDAQCQIKAGCHPKILAKLEEISGITGASLFPDFHGFAWLRAHDKPSVTMFPAKYHRLKGLEALQDNQLDRAIRSFNEAIEACKKGNFDTDLDQIIESRFHRARAYWYRAASEKDLDNAIKDSDEVIRHYEKAIKSSQEHTEELELKLAKDLDNAIKDSDEMIRHYEKAIKSSQEHTEKLELKLAKVYNNRGLAYGHKKKGNFDRAIKDYNKATELAGGFIKAYNNRGLAYAEKKEFDEAIEDYNKAIELQPDYALVYCNRGEAWLHKQDWDKAREDLAKAKKLGVNIIDSFRSDYENGVEEFKEKNCIDDMPKDLQEMLTPQEENLSAPQ